MKDLIPTGKLRAGVAFAPVSGALFVIKSADGTPRGVTVDLGHALAKKLGVAVEFFIAPNTGLLTDELEAGNIDVSFMPVDEERKKRIAFGPVYFLVESTYLATGDRGGGVVIWEADTGEELQVLLGHKGRLKCKRGPRMPRRER